MKPKLHIVTQCTDRKCTPVSAQLRLRNFGGSGGGTRAHAWTRALKSESRTAGVEIRQLYAGEHWVASLNALHIASSRGFDANLWVASAGGGLLAESDRVAPYSATFATGVADTMLVHGQDHAEQRRNWWRSIRQEVSQARMSIGDLAADRGARVLFILSPAYLQALSPEITAALAALSHRDRLVVVSSKSAEALNGPLSANWVESKAQVQQVVGGSRIGQHARLAGAMLSQVPPSSFGADACQAALGSLLMGVPEYVAPVRAPITDSEVRAFIESSGVDSWSRGLRLLRSSGKACEQGRFKQLFNEMRLA